MKFAHPPHYLLYVQRERKQTTHQCCLEDGACCRDMAGYLHNHQKQLDALELKKKKDAIFGAGVVTAIPAYILWELVDEKMFASSDHDTIPNHGLAQAVGASKTSV